MLLSEMTSFLLINDDESICLSIDPGVVKENTSCTSMLWSKTAIAAWNEYLISSFGYFVGDVMYVIFDCVYG